MMPATETVGQGSRAGWITHTTRPENDDEQYSSRVRERAGGSGHGP